MNDPVPGGEMHPGNSNRKFFALFGAVLLSAAAAGGYLWWRLSRLEAEMLHWRASMLSEISELRETSSASAATHDRRLGALRAELETARRQAAASAGQAKVDAQKHAERLAQQLAEEQRKNQQQVETELTAVKENATTANSKISDISTEVTATKSELEKTATDLKRVLGDMGVMSGLIATNKQELAALRVLGERNYFEFTLPKTKQPQRIGAISVLLRKTDPSRNKYTIEVFADDKKVEKKDKNVNEPVQFYVSKARQPYEIVVNEVGKQQITGYLAAPKVEVARK